MRRITKRQNYNKGITLIALVITIIVLLILAGISIETLMGENGLLSKAKKSEEETRGASVEEVYKLWKINQEADKHTGNATAQTLEELMADLINQNLLTEDERDQILGNASKEIKATGQVTIGSRTIVFEEKDLADHVKVGDYVDYNPTVSDKSGTLVEATKLSYPSPIGTAKEHGNRSEVQNFTATADTKWRVLSIENGTVELISEDIIKTNDNANFILRGAIGYLYAEQELNEVCKIFGYGYGADTTKGGTYTVGGPIDTPITGKIEGTGARSITIEDINKKSGVYEDKADGQMKYSDGTVISSSYGDTTNPISNVHYPTVNGDSTTGKSSSAGVKNLKVTYYNYNKSKIENTAVQNMLFNGNYWLASRCFYAFFGNAGSDVRNVNGDLVDANGLCDAESSGLSEYAHSNYAVRPVITLKSNIIDIV